MLRQLGHDDKGIHDGFGGVVTNASAMSSWRMHASFDSSVVLPTAIHQFCPRSHRSMYQNAGVPRSLIPGMGSGVGRALSWLVV